MSDRILFSIGEALIDMIPSRVGCSFDEVPAFSPRVGGAPANVCAAVARLGGRSALLSQLGDDPFGHKIARVLAGCGVELSHLEFTGKASTALAFVSLAENGERTFSFCRKPSADLLYAPEQIDPGWFSQAFALHFCSVSLVDSPMRYAHLAAITAAREAGAILSFDPNLRFPLWPDREQLRQTVWQFLPLTHILKLSDEELPFLTDTEDIEAALPALFTGDVQLVLYTCGSKGARAYTRTASARARSPKVTAVDTTGAGDGFIGSFLWQLQRDGVTAAELPKLSRKRLTEYLAFSNRFCAISVQHHGAIDTRNSFHIVMFSSFMSVFPSHFSIRSASHIIPDTFRQTSSRRSPLPSPGQRSYSIPASYRSKYASHSG